LTATVQPGATVADLKNFVNGQYVTAASGRTSEVVDPSTGEAYALAPVSGAEDVDAALRSAAGDPHFLVSVLDFVLRDDATVKAFASASQLHPTNIAAAHQALSDPQWERDVP